MLDLPWKKKMKVGGMEFDQALTNIEDYVERIKNKQGRIIVSVNSSLNYSTHSPRILKGVISMFQGSSLFQSSAV